FIAITTYGRNSEAEAAIARVRVLHDKVRGTLPDGRPYAASDPWLLGWVHLAEAQCFLAAYRRYVDPAISSMERDRYFAESALIAAALGADPVPRSRAGAKAQMLLYRGELSASAETRHVAELVLRSGSGNPIEARAHSLVGDAALDLIPGWAR